jgi:hypothetical protein
MEPSGRLTMASTVSRPRFPGERHPLFPLSFILADTYCRHEIKLEARVEHSQRADCAKTVSFG